MQQGCEVWEFSDASDDDDVEAEEAALRQHILALADPPMQLSSLEALTAPHVDLMALPSAELWDSLCQGLTACLASTSKQTLLSASSLIIQLARDYSKLRNHTCTAQLFCCMAAATEQASSVQASAAIWQACLPFVRSLAVQLPQTCMHHSETLLAKIMAAFCKQLALCIVQSPLHSSVVFAIGKGDTLDWWHAWLARFRLAKVVPACLNSSGLLDSAINMLQKASCLEKPIALGKLAAIHVLGGTLSLSKGRDLFPRPVPAHGPALAPAKITAKQALQLLIELQHASQFDHAMTASFKAQQPAADSADSAAESAQDAAVSEVGMVSAAAKQMVQSLANQHSCKCHPIFGSTHIQQLLQPCLKAFCQLGTGKLKSSAPSVKGSTPDVNGSASDANGSAAVVNGSPPSMEGTTLSLERQCLPINVETVNGHCDASDMSSHDWEMLRDSWDILADLCQSTLGCNTAMTAMYQTSDTNQPSMIAAVAGVLGWLLTHSSSSCEEQGKVHADAAGYAMLPMLRALSSLGQQYSCYDAIQAASIPDTLLQLVSSKTYALGGMHVYEALLECVVSMCCQPLLAMHVSQVPEALQACATRLATKARQDHSLDWLHQASGLALTQAGQRVLLQAGLPQELLHQLQQLPMQMLDDDSEASREQKRSQTLHNCQVCFGWHSFGKQLLPSPAPKQETQSFDVLQNVCKAALQTSPCPLASSPGCPALPTLEGAAAAVGLLAAACKPLHWRWRIETQLNLSQQLLQQMQSQEEECGSVITDMLTAPRSQLLSMLKPTQGFVLPPPNRHQQHTRDKLGAGTSQGRNVQAGSTTGSMSLSELSVSDPGMKEPEAWWAQVQMALLEGVQQGQLRWRALPLILQRTVMVAMKALSDEDSAAFALTPDGLLHSPQSSNVTSAPLNITGPTQPVAKVLMSAACQASVEAFVSVAQQQLPALAQGLQPHHLQDFLCEMHARRPAPHDSRHGNTASVVEDLDCFASMIWLIMRGDPISQEFLAALTTSQATMYLWPAWAEAAGQAAELQLSQLLGMMLQKELPLLHAALVQCGLHTGHMVSVWHEQCFIDIIGMSDVICYITMGLILGLDWLLYFMLAVLKQQEEVIQYWLVNVGSLDTWMTCGIHFDIRTAVPFMQQLQERWAEVLLKHLVKHVDA